jgi:glutathione S-transferase
LAYAELLPRFPEMVKPTLFGKASGPHRLAANAMWPLSRRMMMRMHDITPGAAAESRSILEAGLDWLDSTRADNRRYLAGDRFSRADITVASLLAFFARPPEMPTYREMSIPAALRADRERWRDRPVMRWVVAQYQAHRAPKPATG